MPKRKIKNTKFGRRAIQGAKQGKDRIKNPDGTHSSVRTATFDIPGKKGRTDVMIAPTIRKVAKKDPLTGKTVGSAMRTMKPKQAAKVALKTGDYAVVRGGKTTEKVQKARAKADKKSQKFSRKLGRIAKKRN